MTPGQSILVVDDDDDFREALSEVLGDAGYKGIVVNLADKTGGGGR